MKHYLTAEWGRAVARPYFRAFLLVLLALAAGVPLLWRWSWRTRSFPINIRMIP